MNNEEIFFCDDKWLSPFLKTAADNGELTFLGHERLGKTIFFKFSPKSKAEKLVSDYHRFKVNLVQPKQLILNIEYWRNLVFGGDERRDNHG